MTGEEINSLMGTIQREVDPEAFLRETHISWVILTEAFVYKIKKPMAYSFLDYSTREKRRYYCYKELILNRRIAGDVYLEVVPVCFEGASYYIDRPGGFIVEHAVKMKRLDESKLMIHLLREGHVSKEQIAGLAKKIARFHHNSDIIQTAFAWKSFDEKFGDITAERQFLIDYVEKNAGDIIDVALEKSTTFLQENADLLNLRVAEGFQRDVHGDLHAKNIFLYEDPVIFDCIEFNDEYRQMDVLNEVAFCCMDLEANGRHDFSNLLLNEYLSGFPAIRNNAERKLFIYFKAYRANVRAKVNALRAKQEERNGQFKKTLAAAGKYLKLMVSYMEEI